MAIDYIVYSRLCGKELVVGDITDSGKPHSQVGLLTIFIRWRNDRSFEWPDRVWTRLCSRCMCFTTMEDETVEKNCLVIVLLVLLSLSSCHFLLKYFFRDDFMLVQVTGILKTRNFRPPLDQICLLFHFRLYCSDLVSRQTQCYALWLVLDFGLDFEY